MLVEEYDAVSGLAGLGRTLVHAWVTGHSRTEPGITAAVQSLTWLLSPPNGPMPRWWLPRGVGSRFAPHAPSGGASTGMAHGVSGPLAFLSIALENGFEAVGTRESMAFAAYWLLEHRTPGTWQWPREVSGDRLRTGVEDSPPWVANDRWCNGSSGIASALHRAGRALGDPVLLAAGVNALAALAAKPVSVWGAYGPHVCCGHAGILRCALSMMRTTPDPRLHSVAEEAAKCLASLWDPDSPFGFRSQATAGTETQELSDLLYGASGIALALHDFATGEDSSWPSLLLLN
ncbi:lanthionine synthetase LanC family protein [Streptomyces sp. NPDC056069]|uniref:lanthionine synthetase LanC family protein n=1 Tax=Streptomyces sp. NPDC056069 TaxID=3345702 RepID=UPI0035DF76AB